MATINSRAIAARKLKKIIIDGKNLDSVLKDVIDNKAFIQQLCYGVCRHYQQLKFLEANLVQKPLKQKDFLVSALILLGLYQLIFLDTESYAAVNETVAACITIKKPWAKNFINAILRNFIRRRDELLAQCQQQLSVQYNHPDWLIKIIQLAYPDQWQTILTANNQQGPLTLRVNQQQISRAKYLELLNKNEIAAIATHYSLTGIVLNQAMDVKQLPLFNEGAISVQDEAAQLATTLLELQPQQNILDACAAPGGKTCHILETQPEVNITALDNDKNRSERIGENLRRLNLKANVITGDATNPLTWWNDELYDRILCDAPCSATGVIRRHPDIKLHRHAEDIAQLGQTQLAILQALWSLLKPGGILLYATCSILPDENDNVLQQFLAQQADANCIAINSNWGIAMEHGRQLLPGETDGFYYAKLVKSP